MNREGWKREGKEARVDRPNRPWPNFFMIGLVTEQWGEIISEKANLKYFKHHICYFDLLIFDITMVLEKKLQVAAFCR